MLQTSWGKETERLKQNLLLQSQKLDAAQQRVAELETQLAKKEHLIAEQKKFLEDVKAQAKYDLTCSLCLHLLPRWRTKLPISFLYNILSCLILSFHNVFLICLLLRGELQASESRYQAQRRVTLALQTELLQLYSRLETEDSSANASALPAESATEPRGSTEPR